MNSHDGGGSIEIHNPGICGQLFLPGAEEESESDMIATEPTSRVLAESAYKIGGLHPQNSLQRSFSRDVGRTGSRESGRLSITLSRDTGRVSRMSSAAQMANVQSWLSRKARRAVVALPEAPELAEVEQLIQSLLNQEHQLISDLEATASSHANEAACKREMLYHKWSSRVFAPLHSKITTVMGGSKFKNMEREKRNLFESYINYYTKQRVFLETVSGTDYNPLSLSDQDSRGTQLIAVTGELDDPLLTQQMERVREQQIITGIHGEEDILAERGLDAVNWLALQLVHVDSSVRQRSRLRVQRDHNERQTGGGHLLLPHKTPATLSHHPFSLNWPEPSSPTSQQTY